MFDTKREITFEAEFVKKNLCKVNKKLFTEIFLHA